MNNAELKRKVGRWGASWYWLPEVDEQLSYDQPVIPDGKYEDVRLTFKFLGTEDSPNWRYIYENTTDDLHSWWPLDFTVGNVYTVGPDGLTFDEAVRVTFAYDPAELPADVEETNVDIFVIHGGQGEIIPGTVDTGAKTVSGFVSGFSIIGITGSGTLDIEPSSLQVPLGGSAEITVVYDGSYYTDPCLYSSDTSVATVDQGGVVSGISTGTAQVGATLDHPVSFTLSDDQYTVPIIYNWDFGDGTTEYDSAFYTGHYYENPGEYEATIQVIDCNGATGSDSVTFKVAAP